MLWRYHGDGRAQPVDLTGTYFGGALFLVGGSPTLKDEPLELLQERGVVTMAVNNAAEIVYPTMWVGGDRPECYSLRILQDPSILKFVNSMRMEDLVEGVPWRSLPGTLVYECAPWERYNFGNFLDRGPDFVWWNNTFFIALQMAWRLGFRRVYLVGAEFRIDTDHQYAWPTVLKPEELVANSALYEKSVTWMASLQRLFARHGLAVKNCCEKSALRPRWGFVSLEEAVAEETRLISRPVDTTLLPHSLRK